MSDHMAAEIRIGGKIAASLVLDLCQAISEQGVKLEWGAAQFQPASEAELLEHRRELDGALLLWLYDDQARWGEFAELEAFLREHDIPFTRQCDGAYEYDPEVVEFRPGSDPVTILTNKSGEPVVPVSTITNLTNALNAVATAASRSAMMRHVKAVQRLLADILPPEVPALESLEIVAAEGVFYSTIPYGQT